MSTVRINGRIEILPDLLRGLVRDLLEGISAYYGFEPMGPLLDLSQVPAEGGRIFGLCHNNALKSRSTRLWHLPF